MNNMIEAKDYIKLAALNKNWYDAISSDMFYIYKTYFVNDKNKNEKLTHLIRMALDWKINPITLGYTKILNKMYQISPLTDINVLKNVHALARIKKDKENT